MNDEQANNLLKALDEIKQNAEDGRTVLILKAISDARNESTKAIGELGSTVAEFHGDITARVNTVEANIKTERNQRWILTYIVLPVLTAVHAICAHFNIKI